jgi:C1A family cysteine protease
MQPSLLRHSPHPHSRKYKLRPSDRSHWLVQAAKPMLMASAEPVPSAVDLALHWYTGIRDQGQEGACTGFSTANFREILWSTLNQQRIPARLSPAYLYARTRMAEGTWPSDSGAMMADEFAVLHGYGVCHEDDMPYDVDPAEAIPNIADAAAVPFRCGPPCTVDMSNPDNAKAVLANGMPIGIAIPVYQSFEDVGSDGILPIPDPSREALLGGHGLCLAGYKMIGDQLYYRGINQWGTGWGEFGYFWMPAGYTFWEAWTAPKS